MASLSMRRLEVFLAVVECGSFAAAADRLGISQPSVSSNISALEEAVGGLAFQRRHGRPPILTEVGRNIVTYARATVGGATALRTGIVRLRMDGGDRIVFSCQRSLANFVLKQDIIRFAQDHRENELVVQIGRQEDVVADIRGGVADVGCFLSNDGVRNVASEVIGRQKLVLVASPSHPIAQLPRLTPRRLRGVEFVGAPTTSSYGRSVERLLADAGVTDIRVVAQVTEYPFIRELVAAGVGISCSPAKNVEDDVRAGKLCVLNFHPPGLVLDIHLVGSARRKDTPAAARFRAYIKSAAFD